ncbi:MAG: hypothetical protein NXI09_14020 [Bacteroidetes bacterium]|nr:hypothetical protein [Bacteroidota bacterium]
MELKLKYIPDFPDNKQLGFTLHYEEEVLPGFSYFRYLTRGEKPKLNMKDLGYKKDSRPSFNAFARRLRVAVCVRSDFEGMGESTARGYAALNQHFLMFTAFERYANEVVGVQERRYHKALPNVGEDIFKDLHKFIKEVDLNGALWQWLLSQKSNHYQAAQLLSFRNGFDPTKGIYVSAMLRNSFAHGVITATPAGVEQGCVQALCEQLCNLLYQGMVEDFWARMRVVKSNIK